MLSFNDFLKIQNEHFIQRGHLPLTNDDDGDYLSQFPKAYHTQALLYRYNDALQDAVVANHGQEMISNGWQDTQDIVFKRANTDPTKKSQEQFPNMVVKERQVGFADVRLEIPRLVKKLKKHGFEIKSMRKLTPVYAHSVMYKWRKEGEKDYDKFKPMSIMKAMNNYNPDYETSVDEKWLRLKDDIVEIATEVCSIEIEKMKDPRHSYHLNYSYWDKRSDDLIHSSISYVHRRLKDINEKKDINNQIKKLISTHINSELQRGNWSRKLHASFKNTINNLSTEPWPGEEESPSWGWGHRNTSSTFSNFIAAHERPNTKGWTGTSGKAFANLQSKIEGRPLDAKTGYLAKYANKEKEPSQIIKRAKTRKTSNIDDMPRSIAAQTSEVFDP